MLVDIRFNPIYNEHNCELLFTIVNSLSSAHDTFVIGANKTAAIGSCTKGLILISGNRSGFKNDPFLNKRTSG
jgi:hypothetical protein